MVHGAAAAARRRRRRARRRPPSSRPAGHGSSPSQRGPRRTTCADEARPGGAVPRPRAWRPARSARRRSAVDVGGTRRTGREQRDAREPRTGGVGDGLDHPCLVGDERPWARADRRPTAASAGRAGRGRRVGRAMLPPGERDRPLPPAAAPGIDEPAGDERRAVAVVDDGRDEPVVLVAEVGASGEPGRRACPPTASAGSAGTPSASVTTSLHGADGRRLAGRAASFEGQRAHEDLGVEDRPRRPPRPRDRSASRSTSARTGAGVARGEDRLRQHEADACRRRARARRDGEGQELGGGVGVRPAAVAAGTAAGRRRGQLRQVRRVAEHDVELLGRPAPRAGRRRALHDRRPRTGRRAARGADRRSASMSTPTSAGTAPSGTDAPGSGDEEASVAARRVEHASRRWPASPPRSAWSTTSSTSQCGVG